MSQNSTDACVKKLVQNLGMAQAVTRHQLFWEACGYGNWIKVEKLIKSGVDVNWRSWDSNKSCPIHVASQGKPEVVKLLIEAKCNINVKDEGGKLPIHHAAMKGHDEIIKMLLDADSEKDCQDNNGWTPLLCAAYWCHLEAVKMLLKNGSDSNIKNKDERTALHEACRSRVTEKEEQLSEIVQQLLDAGCDINMKSSSEGEADFTPLMFAAYHGHTDTVRVLLNHHECHINSQGSNGWTALHWAANRGHDAIVKLLLDAAAETNLSGLREEVPFDVAKSDHIKGYLAPYTDGVEFIDGPPSPWIHRRPEVTTDEYTDSEPDHANEDDDDDDYFYEDEILMNGAGDQAVTPQNDSKELIAELEKKL
ncbi:uncharacterized protein LOC141910278 [Tubulanus polymorphus]|uniref:uncharacterized protein LOC141910278 n=1 Tax=Tubulanus polymorphus TaxID=672921 RepID=UPI003DA5EF37